MPEWKNRISAIILLILIVHLPTLTSAREGGIKDPIIISGHPDYPPFMWQEGDRIVGVGPDLAGIILSGLGKAYQSRYLGPWKRVQETARYGKVDLIAGIYRNIEREAYLEFSEPYCQDPTSVFVEKGKGFAVAGREDLVNRRGVTLFGDSFGDSMDRFIEKELRMARVYSVDKMIDQLLSGKAEYLFFGYYAVRISANRLGVGEKLAVVKKDLVVENFCFAFPKRSPHAALLPKINRQIRRLRDEGRIDALIEDHMNRYLHKAH
ncbi:MAG: transporter substrate-binding domain-containing protein [Deltaproteobacteria bacterium]|nr:transporter substrate-binding domain-containing protein [Deltaproteobacteria bacterium]